MKKTFILICVALTALTTGCDLEKFPVSSISQGTAFQSLQDAAAWHNGFYTALRDRLSGSYIYATDLQADLFNASITYGNRNGDLYMWTFNPSNGTFAGIWADTYSAIKNINFFLDNVHKISVAVGSSDEYIINNYVGEAYLLRAYYYHYLVKLYAKPYTVLYHAVDSELELGLPLVTRYDVEEKPARATLEQTYQLILDDIAAAKTYLTNEGAPNALYLTVDCITALEAQVYLSMGRFDDAAAKADLIITNPKYSLISNQEQLRKMWHRGTDSDDKEALLELSCKNSSKELPATDFDLYLNYNINIKRYVPDFIPEQWTLGLFSNSDWRKQVYFATKGCSFNNTSTNLQLFNKFPGDSTLFTSLNTNYKHCPKMFRLGEMYLIKAEASFRGNKGEAQALAALDTLRKHRGLLPLNGVSGEDLLVEIQQERTREMMGEGTRLYDLKRWNLPVNRLAGGVQNNNTVLRGASANELVRAPSHYQFVWAIPSREFQVNPSLKEQQNSGWED